jgi:hypothetical protein
LLRRFAPRNDPSGALRIPIQRFNELRDSGQQVLVSRGVRVADQDQYLRQIAKPTLKRAEEFGISCGCVAHGVTNAVWLIAGDIGVFARGRMISIERVGRVGVA